MSLFSKLSSFVRNKKGKNPVNSPECELAKDVLETSSAEPSVEPKMCVTLNDSLNHSTQERIHIALVQGSSDSKSVKESVRKSAQPKQTTSTDRYVNITQNSGIRSLEHLYQAPPRAETSSELVKSYCKLYPVLEPSSTERDSLSVKKESIKVKKHESIHDISGEICFQIQPKILYAIITKTGIDQLKNDAKTKVLEMKNILLLQNSINLEYTFNKEIDAVQNYPHVKVYEKMHSFDDVKKCHQRVNQPIVLNSSKDPKAAPIFQSYRQKFRCYKGCKNDVIDCE